MKLMPLLLSLTLALPVLAQRPPVPPLPPRPPERLFRAPGIPPALAKQLGLSAELQRKVREVGFEANEAVISLEAELKRAQLDLERALSQAQVDEPAVMQKLEAISRAELAVRKNRVGLMLRIRKLVGPESWEKMQTALEFEVEDGDGLEVTEGVRGQRRELRIIKHDGKTEVRESNE